MAVATAPPAAAPPTTNRAPSAPGLIRRDARQEKIQRRVILLLTIGPLVGFAAAMVWSWGWGMSVLDLGLLVGFYFATGFGITIGYHRLFTHGAFDARPSVRAAFAVLGSMSVEGAVIDWVADHRRHHAFSDRDGDPHSPHLEETPGALGAFKGLFHAHIGWFLDPEISDPKKWAPDMLEDRTMVRINGWFGRLTLLSFLLPGVIGLAVTRSFTGMLTALLWGGVVRIFLLHHMTWSINSICHYYGKRPFESRDRSTNNWPLAIVSMGESWHNNHHAFPSSARHGMLRGQVDLAAGVISLMEKLRLVSNLRTIPQELMERRLRTEAADATA